MMRHLILLWFCLAASHGLAEEPAARWRPRTTDWSSNVSPVLGDWGFDRPGFPSSLYIHGVTVPAGQSMTNPVIYDNDVYDDVFDDELAMVMASEGEISFRAK